MSLREYRNAIGLPCGQLIGCSVFPNSANNQSIFAGSRGIFTLIAAWHAIDAAIRVRRSSSFSTCADFSVTPSTSSSTRSNSLPSRPTGVAFTASTLFDVSFALGADSDSAIARDSTPRPGGATLAGVVTNSGGHPVEGAQVVIDGSALSAVTDARGAFSLTGLPDGTRTAEARALGYAPSRVTVEPSRSETRKVTIVMGKAVRALDAVTVYGKPTGRMRDLSGFMERKRQGFGRFITRADIDQSSAISVCDLLRRVVGLQVMEGGLSGCAVSVRGSASMIRAAGGGGTCQPTVYLDNAPFGGGVSEFTREVSPQQIMGIEVYTTATAPPQFAGPCGSIVVWTRT